MKGPSRSSICHILVLSNSSICIILAKGFKKEGDDCGCNGEGVCIGDDCEPGTFCDFTDVLSGYGTCQKKSIVD